MYKILENKKIANNVFQMILEGDTTSIKNSGQFINILIEGFYLRRPISIKDYDNLTITIIYKIMGQGTKKLATYQKEESLDILVGLGNGFTAKKEKSSLLIGGGVGVPPLYNLAKELKALGNEVSVVLGFASKEDVFLEEELKKLDIKTYVATMDNTYGYNGNVIDLIKDEKIEFETYYACGPKGMLNALIKNIKKEGQLSFEERMGCGFGACMGCSMKTKEDYKRVCKEGPVFSSSEVII